MYVSASYFENTSLCSIFYIMSTYRNSFHFVGKDNMKETDLCTTIPQYEHKANYFECKKTVVGSFLNITRAREPRVQFTLCEVEVFQTKISEYVLPS